MFIFNGFILGGGGLKLVIGPVVAMTGVKTGHRACCCPDGG